MRLNDILITEGLSKVLYHATTFQATLDIFKNNTLGYDKREISFARSLTGNYHLGNKIIGVIFEIDGQKLGQRFKGKPVGTEEWEDDDNINYRGRDNKQLEERIAGPVPNFTSYVKNAIIFIPEEYLGDSDVDEFDEPYAENLEILDKVMDQLDAHNISYRVVTKEKNLFDKRADDRDKLDALIASQYNQWDNVPDGIAKKFNIDQRTEYTVTIWKGYDTERYMDDFDVDEDEVDYLDQSYYIGPPVVVNRKADSQDHAEDAVYQQLIDKFGMEKGGKFLVFADDEDD